MTAPRQLSGEQDHDFLGPFGNPDGSRAQLDDVLRDFTDFAGNPAYASLASRPDDLTARIVVGKLGAGKTVYLRRFQAAASSDPAIYADPLQQDPFTTDLVVRICHWYQDAVLDEMWMLLWRRAILRSIVSHLLRGPHLKEHVSAEDRELLLTGFEGLWRPFGAPLSIYTQLAEIIRAFKRPHQLADYLQDPRWDELEYVVSGILRDCPPLCFYIDAVDEEFGRAPMYWMRCQLGLFHQVMRYLRDPKFGARLHVIVAIRDIVLSAVLRGEGQNRYRGEPHIRILDWDIKAIRYFLNEKLGRLTDGHQMQPGADANPVARWLGRSTVPNLPRAIDEDVEDYILRHTRLLPRDVIMMGNLLCAAITKAQDAGERELSDEVLRRSVATAARWFGNQQLVVCCNQIAADTMPKHAAEHDFSEVYTGTIAYRRGIEADLRRYLRAFKHDRIDKELIADANRAAASLFDSKSDVLTVLWHNGLIGYVDLARSGNDPVFYSVSDMDDFHLPQQVDAYVLHPCVIDAVGGIQGVGDPVRSYAR